jgi:hypothetical protein
MQSYTPGLPVAITLALVDSAGVALTPTALKYRVIDEDETALVDWTDIAVADPVQTEVTISISGVLNILTPPAVRGARTAEVEVTTAGGTVTLSDTVAIQGSTALAHGQNTFLTFTAAQLLSRDFADNSMPGWLMTQGNRAQQEAALIEAFDRIVRLPIELQWDDTQSILNIDTEFTTSYGPYLLRNLTATQVLNLYPQMLEGLRKAQLVEADEILNGDPIRTARKNGALSMTVGESSQFFRTSKPLDLGVSERALAFVSRWIRIGAVIGRR